MAKEAMRRAGGNIDVALVAELDKIPLNWPVLNPLVSEYVSNILI
jgi:hypothetical protein